MRAAPLRVLMDTSTLLRARLDRFDPVGLDDGGAATIHALLFNDEICLDADSIDRNERDLLWLSELDDGITRVDLDVATRGDLYRRGASLIPELAGGVAATDFARSVTSRIALDEMAGHDYRYSSLTPRQLLARRHPRECEAMATVFPGLLDRMRHSDGEAYAVATLLRLFYYTALQEHLGCSLMLDPSKDFLAGPRAPHDVAGTVLAVFGDAVASRHRERRRRWLGETDLDSLPVPLVGRYLCRQAEERGWSIGRTAMWLRHTAEVVAFRDGLRHLTSYLDSDDNERVDSVLAELDRAAARWSEELGSREEVRRMKVTVPLPFAEPEIEIPVGRLARRTPAQKMLVLVARTLRYGPVVPR